MRAKQAHVRLPGSSLWVQTPESAVAMMRERHSLRLNQEPVYLANDNEQVVLADLVKQSVPVVLVGPPGIGKMTLVRSVFHRLNVPLQSFMASPGSSASQLLGRQGVGGAQGELLTWVDGSLSLAARAANGGCVNGFYLDELPKLPGELMSYILNIIDGRQALALPTGEEIDLRGHLKMVFSYNPGAGARLDDALRSRLVAIRVSYPTGEVEANVLRHNRLGGLERFSQNLELSRGLVQFANIIRRAAGYEVDLDFPPLSDKETKLLRMIPSPPSTRLLVTASRMISVGSYGSHDAALRFILPSLLQESQDAELPPVMNLLRQMVEALIPKVEGTRQKLTFKDVDTLFEEENALMQQEEEAAAESERAASSANRDWLRKH